MRFTSALVVALFSAAAFSFFGGNNEVHAQGTYTVQPGDTLSGIARQHGVDYQRLADASPDIDNPDRIFPGDEVRLSGSSGNGRSNTNNQNTRNSSSPSGGSVQSADRAAAGPSGGNIRSIVERHFPAHAVNDAMTIIQCESGGNPSARNYNPPAEDSHGLFQVNNLNMPGRGSRAHLINPENNVAFAAELYRSQGRFGSTSGWFSCAARHGIY